MMIVQHSDSDFGPWTWGTGGKDGQFGGAYPSGRASLRSWVTGPSGEQVLVTKTVRCRSYRRAVYLLRLHLKGHNV